MTTYVNGYYIIPIIQTKLFTLQYLVHQNIFIDEKLIFLTRKPDLIRYVRCTVVLYPKRLLSIVCLFPNERTAQVEKGSMNR
jgi:hypothetical protein